MNIMRQRPLREALYARSCAGLSGGHIVYTEDVGGSSPSSPTIRLHNKPLVYIRFRVSSANKLHNLRRGLEVH